MHIVYLDKKIVLENLINEINLINIDEDITYLNRNDGILIKGLINVSCEYLSMGVIKQFNDYVDVSILVPYENIITNEVQFKLQDFDYFINGNNLSLSFKINIEGYKEIEKTFQDENKEMEIVSNVEVEMKDIQNIIDSNPEDVIELNNLEINIEKNNKADDNKKYDDGKRLEFNINGDDLDNITINLNNEKQENISSNETIIKEKKSFFDTIFKKDKKIKMWKYRVILENDNYEDIAKEYNVNLYKLKEINHNMLLEIGKIIKIPNYHE